jgi:hypothetical protein
MSILFYALAAIYSCSRESVFVRVIERAGKSADSEDPDGLHP